MCTKLLRHALTSSVSAPWLAQAACLSVIPSSNKVLDLLPRKMSILALSHADLHLLLGAVYIACTSHHNHQLNVLKVT